MFGAPLHICELFLELLEYLALLLQHLDLLGNGGLLLLVDLVGARSLVSFLQEVVKHLHGHFLMPHRCFVFFPRSDRNHCIFSCCSLASSSEWESSTDAPFSLVVPSVYEIPVLAALVDECTRHPPLADATVQFVVGYGGDTGEGGGR